MSSLYVSDLDGTLLTSEAKLSETTRRELTDMLNVGLPFTVASARSVVSMQAILDGLPLRLPVIEFNGAFISEPHTGRHLATWAMEGAVAERVVAMAWEAGVPPFLSLFDGRRDRLQYVKTTNVGMQWYVHNRQSVGDKRLEQVADLSLGLREQVVCITLIEREGLLHELAGRIRAECGPRVDALVQRNIYSPDWLWLTVRSEKATKAAALRYVAGELGVDLADVTVFGDDTNDIPMFETAGRAVAVENAVAELKRCADEVIGPHESDSVVEYLRQHWPG